MTGDAVVRAAGGIVVRASVDGEREVLLVHRPRYDDWSLPKGKADPGETDEACAAREVEEETAIRVALEEPIGVVRYEDRFGRSKVVRYWRMRVVEDTGRFTPNHEIDAIAWCSVEDAVARLTYEHDRDLVSALPTL